MKYLLFFTCLFLFAGFTIAFIPGMGSQFADWSSITHRVITRAGLWATVLEFLEKNPEYEDKNQVSKHFLSSLERQGLFEGQIPQELFGYIKSSKFENAVREIEKANEAVDTIEEELTAAHVDAEQFLRSSRRLVTLKRMVISLINKTDANENSYAAARKETGRLLHTLQDFYSHSNWIEAGNKEPLKILGDKIIPQEYVAGKDQKTCNDCTPASWLRPFFPVDDCENNLIPDLGKLTSGYKGEEDVAKPPSVGKCSHGGLIDKSRYVHSTGGMNKDASKRYLSPHYRLHKQAASVAINATKLFFDSVRAAVGDKLFAKYLSMKVVNTLSLAFDTTGNTNDEIAGVQKATEQFIEDSAATDEENDLHYVLVPFNGNPEFGPAYVARDPKAAKEKVNSLKASGKPGKHSKLGMNGLYQVLTHSLPKSDVYYFSDDSAKKAHLSLPVLSLALEKQCKIHSFISGDTSSRRRKRRDISGGQTLHESLATTTGGQLIEYEKSGVDNAIKLVRRPGVPAGNKSLVLQEVSLYAAVEVKNLLSKIGKVYDVKSDSSIVSMTVVLSADENPHIQVIPPQDHSRTANITIITQTSTVYSVRITHPVAGNWRFNITATGSYSLHVRAQSNLAFSTSLQRKGVSQKSFSTISGHPIKGQKLFVTVVPSQQNILLQEKHLTAYVIDPAGNELDSFELERGQLLYDNAFYGSIVMNFDAFKLMYIGHSTTRETVQRLLSRLIKPQEFEIKLKPSTKNSSLVLSPDEITSFNVTLYNYGPRQRFSIQASDGKSFVTSYKPKFATLNSNDSIDIQIDLRAPVNTNDGTTSFLSIAASVPSSSGAAHDKANFISLPFSVFSKEFLFINETELGDANLTEFLSPQGKKQSNAGDGFPFNVILLIVVGAVIVVGAILLSFARKKKSMKSGRGIEGSGLINNDYA